MRGFAPPPQCFEALPAAFCLQRTASGTSLFKTTSPSATITKCLRHRRSVLLLRFSLEFRYDLVTRHGDSGITTSFTWASTQRRRDVGVSRWVTRKLHRQEFSEKIMPVGDIEAEIRIADHAGNPTWGCGLRSCTTRCYLG